MITIIIIPIILFILGFVLGMYVMKLRWMEKDPESFMPSKIDRKIMNETRKPVVVAEPMSDEERHKEETGWKDFEKGLAPSAKEIEEQNL